ncbi:MAG: PAS domain S-box protein [Polyangiaceae bacterium]|nr:PAS domain S-box protein [Polyangiaceae bacterium]
MSTLKRSRQLSAFIRERQAAILSDWEHAVRALPPAQKLDRPALLDDIPDLLVRIADMADAIAQGKPPVMPTESAEEHALHRLGEGFDLSEVVAEYGVLRECVLRLWEKEPAAPEELPVLRVLNRAIDKAVGQSVQRYVQARDQALQALDRVSTAAFESKDLDDFLWRLLHLLVETTPVIDAAAILIKEENCLRVRASVGARQDGIVGLSLALQETLAGTVAIERSPLFVGTGSSELLEQDPIAGKLGVQVLYAVPLVDRSDVVGVAIMGARTAHEFSPHDKRLFTAMVNRATVAIFHHLLREAAETRARRQEAIAQLGIAALEVGDAEQLTNHALELVAKTLAADMVGLFEVLPGGKTLQLRAGVGWNAGMVGRVTIDAGKSSQCGYTLVTGEPVVVEDLHTESRFSVPAFHTEHESKSGMSVIIYARGQGSTPHGVLAAYTRSRRSFSADDVHSLQSTANLIAQAIARSDMEQSLRRSEERFRSLVTASSSAVWTVNAEGLVEEPSPTWQAFTGQSDEQYCGRGWLDAVHPEDRARTMEAWDRAHAKNVIYETEYRVRARTGEYRWMLVRGAPVTDIDGTTREWIGMNIDITDRKRIEEQLQVVAAQREELIDNLRVTTERLQTLISGSPLAIIAMDEKGNVQLWNPAAERLFGWTEEDVLGRPTPTIPEEYARQFQNNMATLLHAGEPVTMEVTRLRRDGSRIELSLWAAPRRDAHGKIVGTLSVCADVTDAKRARKQVEQALEQAQQAVRTRENVLAIVSHDLRNPLNVISLNTTLLMNLLQNDARARQRVEIIQRSASRMARLIGDLLDMASIQVGKLSLERDMHAVDTMVLEAVEMHQSIAAERTIHLNGTVNVPRSTQVSCDRERVLQVLSNLLGNAIKFSSPGSTITVSADGEASAKEVLFAVTDQGPGVAPEQLAHIFEPYWTSEQSARKGTGLGLFIAKGIVDAHGGRIWVETKAGVGTTFYFTLPY